MFLARIIKKMQNDSEHNKNAVRRNSKYDTYIHPNISVGDSILSRVASENHTDTSTSQPQVQPHINHTQPVHSNHSNSEQYYISPKNVEKIKFEPAKQKIKTKSRSTRRLIIGPIVKATVQIDKVTKQSILAAKRTFEPSKKIKYKTKKAMIMHRGFYTLATLSLVFTIFTVVNFVFNEKNTAVVINNVGVGVKGVSTIGTIPFEAISTSDDMSSYNVAPQYPRWIRIPTIGLWSKIKKIGLKADGSLAMPDNIYDVGWTDDSFRPGNLDGATVLAGYVAGPNNNGAFADLYKLQAGNSLEVEKGNGEIVRYHVTKVIQNSTPLTDLSKLSVPEVKGKHDLKLVSIIGTFSKTNGWNHNQVIVYASLL